VKSCPNTGPKPSASKTCEPLEPTISPPSISCAVASLVRISAPRAREMAWTVIGAVFGGNSSASSESLSPDGLWSKTSTPEPSGGLTPCVGAWESSGTKRYRSRLRRATLERLISDAGSSLLPTPSASRYGTSGNGDPHDGRGQYAHRGTPSLHTLAKRGLLPTATAGGCQSVRLTPERGEQGEAGSLAHGRSGPRPERPRGPAQAPGATAWTAQPGVGGVAHGLSTRVDRSRLQALGNAVVPQCAQVVGEIIRIALEPSEGV